VTSAICRCLSRSKARSCPKITPNRGNVG
jgi:hypothetical protein